MVCQGVHTHMQWKAMEQKGVGVITPVEYEEKKQQQLLTTHTNVLQAC
jgi:hypothetical protein